MTEQVLLLPEQTQLSSGQDYQQEPISRTVKIMERLHASDVFATPEGSKVFLDSLDYDEFKRYISLVNGLELGLPTNERGEVSDSHVQYEGMLTGVGVEYRPPHKAYRERLLKSSFEKAQSIDDPEMAGLTLGFAINAIHYFADGNGRTARMVYSLLSRGYDGSPEAQEYYSSLLEMTKGREVVNPNPALSELDRRIRSELYNEVSKKFGYDEAFDDRQPTFVIGGYTSPFVGEETPDTLVISDDISPLGRSLLYRTMESGGMTMISLMAAFKPDRVKDHVRTSPDGARTVVVGDTFLPTLTEEEIKKWWNKSEQSLAVYVKRVIDVSDRQDAHDVLAYYSANNNPPDNALAQ